MKLELAGTSWTVTSGVSDRETWSGTVNVADYATRGQGIYKVLAFSKSASNNECFRRAYVKVEGEGGPLSTTAGQVAAGVGALGAAGALAAGAKGSKEIDDVVEGSVVGFLENQGRPPETTEGVERDRLREEAEQKHGHELHLLSFCGSMIILAALATVKAVASDVGHHVTAAIGGWFR